jgi:phosphoribosylformylglycinamidine synthase
VNFKTSKQNMGATLEIIRKDLAKCVHDCSKGGLSIAVSELCMSNNIGCKVSLDEISSNKLQNHQSLFSETHSRYLAVVSKKDLNQVKSILSKKKVSYNLIGIFEGKKIIFEKNSKNIVDLSVDKTRTKWMSSLKETVLHG